jgi:hypothetical protein
LRTSSSNNPSRGRIIKDGAVAAQALFDDPQPFVPATVDQAEVYYQNTPVSQFPSGTLESILNLWGQHPVINDANITINYGNLTSPGLGHSEVPFWYLCNVVPHLPSTTFVFPPPNTWMVCWTDETIPGWLSKFCSLPASRRPDLTPLDIFARLYAVDADAVGLRNHDRKEDRLLRRLLDQVHDQERRSDAAVNELLIELRSDISALAGTP